jgi:hypothetical protein
MKPCITWCGVCPTLTRECSCWSSQVLKHRRAFLGRLPPSPRLSALSCGATVPQPLAGGLDVVLSILDRVPAKVGPGTRLPRIEPRCVNQRTSAMGCGYKSCGCNLRLTEVRSGSFGVASGFACAFCGPQAGPTSTPHAPTGPRPTSNCSHMRCSHNHKLPKLRWGPSRRVAPAMPCAFQARRSMDVLVGFGPILLDFGPVSGQRLARDRCELPRLENRCIYKRQLAMGKWLELMWLQFEVGRGPVGVAWGRFGLCLGLCGPQAGPKSTPHDPDLTSGNLKVQSHEL